MSVEPEAARFLHSNDWLESSGIITSLPATPGSHEMHAARLTVRYPEVAIHPAPGEKEVLRALAIYPFGVPNHERDALGISWYRSPGATVPKEVAPYRCHGKGASHDASLNMLLRVCFSSRSTILNCWSCHASM